MNAKATDEESEGKGLSLTKMRVFLLCGAFLFAADTACLAKLSRSFNVYVFIIAIMGGAWLAEWLLIRWARLDIDRVRLAVASPPNRRSLQVIYRASSLFVVYPFFAATMFANASMAETVRDRELRPVYGAIRAHDYGLAIDALTRITERESWEPQYAILVGLICLETGDRNCARQSIESGIVDSKTRFQRFRGVYVERIDRSTCDRYIAQARFYPGHDDLARMLQRDYCRNFFNEFSSSGRDRQMRQMQ